MRSETKRKIAKATEPEVPVRVYRMATKPILIFGHPAISAEQTYLFTDAPATMCNGIWVTSAGEWRRP